MRIFIGVILLSVSFVAKASEPLRIGVIADMHYLSEKLMDDGSAVDRYMQSSGRMIKYTPFILDSVLNHYSEGWADDIADIDILLVCGDMTKDGEKQSHLDFVKKLKPLQDKNVSVFVVPGNHDINMPNSVGFRGDKIYKVDNISPAKFEEIYRECGFNQAFRRDTASLSYVSVIDKYPESETWLLAIDAARYDEYTTHSISGGRVLPQTERWILDILEEAKRKNAHVIGMMHWGLVEHFPMQSALMKDYLVDDWERLANLFADNGLKAIFTGHSHANDITKYTSSAKQSIYDIETGTLSSYPFSYRFIDYYPTNMNISTFNIDSLPQNPNLSLESKAQLYNLTKVIGKQKIKSFAFGLPAKTQEAFSDILAQVFLLHVRGDEVVSNDLKMQIQALMGADNVGNNENFELDFFPPDNSVIITF